MQHILVQRLLLIAVFTTFMAACSASGSQQTTLLQQTLQHAQLRWEAQQIPHYRLLVQEASLGEECQQLLQIQDQQIEQILLNQCGTIAHWTVPNLFTWVAQHPERTTHCFPSTVTCVCYITYSIHASYDATYGYPTEMTSQWNLAPNWSYSLHWQRLFETGRWPNCQSVNRQSQGFVRIRVLDFVVLP